MLEEVGKRHGETRGRFFISIGSRRCLGVGAAVNDRERLCGRTWRRSIFWRKRKTCTGRRRKTWPAPGAGCGSGKIDEAKLALQAVKDLKQAFQMVMDERARVEKLRKQVAGVVRTSMPSISTPPGLRSGAAWLASATPEVVDEFLSGLDDNALLALPWMFEFWALPHQLPPDGAWKTWVIMGGRGAGKTRAGAEWVRAEVEGATPEAPGRARRVALVGETIDQVREVMVFGESGLLACSPPDRRPEWEAGRKRLVWPNGAVAQVFSAHEPESLRGPQFVIGIDNYMPISDWRDGEQHADKAWGSIYNPDYLKANIAGGEGYDWYYPTHDDAEAQRRVAISDGEHDEPWIYRYKDLKSWWSLAHHDRVGGVRKPASTAWVPRSKPIRFTELGCPAIDKGTNEPNKFVDPKSSESRAPRFSSGRRDDLIQMQYLRAQSEFWRETENNPVSPIYSGRMVDVQRAHVWAWDARPFPVFPNLSSAWSDGGNYARGHWLNGRATGQVLGSVVADLCEKAGVKDFDVSTLYGYLRGYTNGDVASARAILQPLMLAYGFDAVERDGQLRFQLRNADVTAELTTADLVRSDELDGTLEATRSAQADVNGRVRLSFVEAEGAFATRQAEAIFPDDQDRSVSQSEMPLTLTLAEGRSIVERWLSDARIARDGVRFALPKSRLSIGAGDVVQLASRRYRIDRIEQAEHQILEGSRVEAVSLSLADAMDETSTVPVQVAPVPVYPLFLDLPLLDGTEVPHAPHIAISANPWPGNVAVWSSASDDGYVLNRVISTSTVVGVTETALPRARPGLIDRGPALRVKVYGGTLQSAESLSILNGANTAAIGDGSPAGWEVFQFTSAVLVEPDLYELTGRIRAQAGSEPEMGPAWPAGSQVVFLRRGLDQLDLPLGARGLERHYRIGAASRGTDDPTVVLRRAAFDGIGLRPYRPVHLASTRLANGDVEINWIRRSRIDGDGWNYGDVPLGEDRESYRIRVFVAGVQARVETSSSTRWTYSFAARAQDGANEGCRVEVAQISDRFGPGPGAVIELAG